MIIWEQKLDFECWHNISKTRASCFIRGSKHRQTDESTTLQAGLLLFRGVWNPWWNTKHEFFKWLLSHASNIQQKKTKKLHIWDAAIVVASLVSFVLVVGKQWTFVLVVASLVSFVLVVGKQWTNSTVLFTTACLHHQCWHALGLECLDDGRIGEVILVLTS